MSQLFFNEPLGMVGIILTLHFGLFHFIALFWQGRGIVAEPIMRAPLTAASLGDFWGKRWNLGFRFLSHEYVFHPVSRVAGTLPAILVAFVASGLIHELVISLPARGGYGLPTLYFSLQGLGVVIERSSAGTVLHNPVTGRLFALLCTVAPLYWLFHPLFVKRVILPFMVAIRAL